jgi:hypothetical protein
VQEQIAQFKTMADEGEDKKTLASQFHKAVREIDENLAKDRGSEDGRRIGMKTAVREARR